ncbi:MAG: hypothetical protein KC502_03135 [Myxococcales bacterium]|nr:hypothetical protein [Myxococcales bacterium]
MRPRLTSRSNPVVRLSVTLTLCAVACLSGCGTEAVDGTVTAGAKLTDAQLRTDTRGEDAYAGVNFTIDCRLFSAATEANPWGNELSLPGQATVVVLDGPATPISITGTKIALPTIGDYTVACRVPSAGLSDDKGTRLEVIAGMPSEVDTHLQVAGAKGTKTLTVQAGTHITVTCTGSDAWQNTISEGWSVVTTPDALALQPGTTKVNKAGTWQVACRSSGLVDATPATLVVTPAAPRHLFTLLDPKEISAGDAAKLACVATDTHGNTVPNFPFAMDFPTEVQLKGLYVTSTTAGIHTVKCVPETDKWSLYQLHPANLQVQPGPAHELLVARVPEKPVYKREEKVKFPALVKDAWGNVRVDDPVTVQVLSPATGAKILEAGAEKDKLIKFDEDGTYKLRFEVSLTSLSKELSVLVDGAPPMLTIEDPPWGSTLTGKPSVQIKGKAGDAGSGVKTLTVNGKTGYVDGANEYVVQQGAKHGLNTVIAIAEDMGGEKSEATRGFYYSGKYYNTDAGKPKGAMVKDAMQIFIGKQLFDDGVHDPAHPNDFATIIELLAGAQLAAGLVPSSPSSGNISVTLSNTKMGKPKVSLTPVTGALDVKLRIENFSTDLKVKAKIKLGPIKTSLSVSGTLTMSAITTTMRLKMAVSGGKASASVANSDVKIDGMKLSVNGIGGLFNPLFNLLLGSYKKEIENQLKSALVGELPKALNSVLSQLSTSQTFDVPPSMGNGPPVKVTLVSEVKTLSFTPDGALLKTDASFVAPKGTKHTILGAISRAGCIGKSPDKFTIDKKQAMQIALHDDLINQLLYAIWYGGAMTMTVPGSELAKGQSSMGFDLEKGSMEVDLLLPPILEACNMAKPEMVRLQIGDIFTTVRVPFGSDELALYMASSIDAPAEISFGPDDKGVPTVTVTPGKSPTMLVELTDISKTFTAQKAAFSKIIKDAVAKQLAKGSPLGKSIVVPMPPTETDLSSLAPSIPKGTKTKMVIKGVARKGGYTALNAALE